ncbi:YbbR-like domain-containing protein [uncultured Proteiniphilum sp.]|uniref:YbbR-like domain-containing protein n=1 Tax=uncultured Proteiniphilum sp. TaxID=497637 RepID=UPI00261F1536|nr:YbbR-like domain-containing protein [uncultured Proteiniphilum sp.]
MEIRAVIKKWKPGIEAFFSTFPWKNVLSFLFFLLLAFIFWLMLFFQKENVEGTYRIPLKYTNISDDVVFDNPLPLFIEVSVADNGAQIFRLDMRKKDSLEINVTELTEEGNTVLQGDQYKQLIRSQLFPSTNIRGYYPMNISLATSKLQSKELPVVFDGEITTNRANLVADSATFIPEVVMAYGSQKSLDKLKGAVTEYTVFKNLKATSQLPVRINNVEGVKFVPSQVDIYIPIEEYTERTFEVPITAAHMPKKLDVKFFPSRASVTFSVTLEEYRKIVPEDFSIELDYRKFHSNEDGRVELELTVSPSSIINPRISPTSVEFLFENKTSE